MTTIKENLDKLFADRNEREQKVIESKTDEQIKHQLFREQAIEIITSTILPVLDEFKLELENRGHEFKICPSLEKASYPNVRISFTLIDNTNKNNIRFPTTTSLTLVFSTTTNQDNFEASIINREKNKASIPIEKINKDWVSLQVSNFVKLVIQS